MNTEQDTRGGELPMVLQRIQHLTAWASSANSYVDQHNASPPDGSDDVTREELVLAMEELGGLMHRYADSLSRVANREPSSVRSPSRSDGVATAKLGTLLQFPTRRASSPSPTSRSSTDQRVCPFA